MKTRLIDRTDRLTTIERLLFENPGGLRVVEIAKACGVDRRTIYRDLSVLTDFGLPIYQKDARFFINREYYLATLRLNLNEAVTLFASIRMLTHHAEQQNPHVVSLLRKLGIVMPGLAARHVRRLAEMTRQAPVDRGFIKVLETMMRAWGEGRKVELWYNAGDGGEANAREFATYFIEITPGGTIYLVGYDALSHCIRSLRLRRVVRVRLLRATYDMPEQFDPQPYLAAVWGGPNDDTLQKIELVLRFSANVIPIIKERGWDDWQSLEELDDGRYVLRIHVTDWRAVLSWIRSWGAQVEVLKPQFVREELRAEAMYLATLYSASVYSGQVTTTG